MSLTHAHKKWFRMGRVEIALVVGFIGAMAAIMIPTSRCEVEDVKRQIAITDISALAGSLDMLLDDIGALPVPPVLLGPGERPVGLSGVKSAAPISSVLCEIPPLMKRTHLSSCWKGPYIDRLTADPWGRSYLIVTIPGPRKHHSWVLSTGPDGRLDTDVKASITLGDDIGVRVR